LHHNHWQRNALLSPKAEVLSSGKDQTALRLNFFDVNVDATGRKVISEWHDSPMVVSFINFQLWLQSLA